MRSRGFPGEQDLTCRIGFSVRLLLITLLVLPLNQGLARADDAPVDLTGIGSRTCAYWLSSRDHKLEGTVWIYGFWSGLNYVAVASQQPQSKATDSAMIAAVEAVCKREPSSPLATAAWSAYIDLSKG